jgi:hypothetical protein
MRGFLYQDTLTTPTKSAESETAPEENTMGQQKTSNADLHQFFDYLVEQGIATEGYDPSKLIAAFNAREQFCIICNKTINTGKDETFFEDTDSGDKAHLACALNQ